VEGKGEKPSPGGKTIQKAKGEGKGGKNCARGGQPSTEVGWGRAGVASAGGKQEKKCAQTRGGGGGGTDRAEVGKALGCEQLEKGERRWGRIIQGKLCKQDESDDAGHVNKCKKASM